MENNKGQALVGIIIVLVIVGLLGGGFYVYLSKQIPEVTEKPTGGETSKSEKADWKIYQNEEKGFKVSYPKNWYTEDMTTMKEFIGGIVAISSFPNAASVKEFPEGEVAILTISLMPISPEELSEHISRREKRSTITEFVVNNIKVYKVRDIWILNWYLFDPDTLKIYNASGDILDFKGSEERFNYYENILDDIISTFRVLE
ncbi:MAG: PsbP-related protein [Candidatus Nealsonbacteria bacterium]